MARRLSIVFMLSIALLLLAAPAHADDVWCLIHWSHC